MVPERETVPRKDHSRDLRLTMVSDGCMSVKDAVAYSGFKRTRLYEAIASGSLPSVQDGGRVVIPKRALDEFLADRLRLS